MNDIFVYFIRVNWKGLGWVGKLWVGVGSSIGILSEKELEKGIYSLYLVVLVVF